MGQQRHINTFEGGMDSDISPSGYPKNKYLFALNQRLGSIEGQSSGSLTTIEGNLLGPVIPNAWNIFLIEESLNTLASPWNDTFQINFAASSISGAISGTTTNFSEYLDEVEDLINTNVAFTTKVGYNRVDSTTM